MSTDVQPDDERTDPGVDPDVARWRAARREVIRTHHPDRGGDADELRRRLEQLDRTQPDRTHTGHDSADAARISPTPHSAPVERLLRTASRGRRRARSVSRSVRARLPPGWPGAQRFHDL